MINATFCVCVCVHVYTCMHTEKDNWVLDKVCIIFRGQDNVVGTATHCRLDGLGIESRWG
jgi:hypothetical protein